MSSHLENEQEIEEEEEDILDYNASTTVTTTIKNKQEITSISHQAEDKNLDQKSNASGNNEMANEESFESIKISSDSENVYDGTKISSNNRNIQQQQQQQQIIQQQQQQQQHSFEDEEEEEEDKEIQLREVSKWRKQSQEQQQEQQRKVETRTQNVNPNVNTSNDQQFSNDEDHQFISENIPNDEDILRQKFQQFMEEKKQKCVLFLDEGRVNLLPAQLRQPIQNIINTVKRLTARNPTGAPLSALQILAERLDEFLELQEHRNDRNYELRCRDLLSIIYRNTIEAQRLSRQLRDAATPRSLDEYENC